MKTSTALMLLVSLLFVSLSVLSTHSYFSTTAKVKENVLSASSWHTPEEAIEEVSEILQTHPSGVFELTDQGFKDSFSKEDFEAAVAATGIEIKSVIVIEPPRIFGKDGEWAEAVLELTISDGSVQQFRVIFGKESGLWRIFGTEEIGTEEMP